MISSKKSLTVAQRDALGDAFPIIGLEYPNLVVLSPDVSKSTRALRFKDQFPERFVVTGISEQNTLGMAAGFATSGFIPLVAGYAMFVGGKAWEPIRNSIAYPNLNVKIVATHAGLNVGPDGVTHQATEDIALMRAIPNMTVLAPTDATQVLPVLRAALDHYGPVYIRLERAPMALYPQLAKPFTIGSSNTLRAGQDVAIMAVGSMVAAALQAATMLERNAVQARVISMASIKPLDEETIIKAASETGAIVTAEDHNVFGGLAGAVSELLVRRHPVPMESVAVQDTFAESGPVDQLRQKYQLMPADIVKATMLAVDRKRA